MDSLENPKRLKLIYRGSANGFKAADFHEKCGEVENTLTLVKNSHGKTFAAFNPYKWHSVQNNQWVSNTEGGSFILLLDLKERLIPMETTKLIFNYSSYGPCFGGINGCDMIIGDQCNITANSSIGYVSSYNTANQKYENNQ